MKLRCIFMIVVLGASFALPTRSLAASPEAREAYEVGKRAYDVGQYAFAARSFARADALAPNARVLEVAMAAALKAEDAVLGMELAERARARGLPALSSAARDLFVERVGRVRVLSAEGVNCSAKLDDEPLTIGEARWATVGDHTIALDVDGFLERRVVRVESGRTVDVEPAPTVRLGPPAVAPPPPSATSWVPQPYTPTPRLRPSWFWVGASATVVLGTAAVASGVHTIGLHDDFGVDRANAELADRGHAAELRTNVLLLSTGLVALATGVVGFLVFGAPKEVARGLPHR